LVQKEISMANTPNNPQRNPTDFGGGTTRFGTQGYQGQQHQGGSSVTERAKDAASDVTERAKDYASSAAEQARGAVSSLGEKAQDVASQIGQKASDTWEAGREYVTEHGFTGMMDDLASIIRRNPIPSLLIGFGLGFMLARTLRD
jgi:hypothetical protein